MSLFGEPLTIGRKSRTPSRPIRRALERRDRGTCQAPACTQRRFLHAHHIIHWIDGGETAIWNLVLVCSHHHHLLHEGGWNLQRRPDGGLDWCRPKRKGVMERRPPPITPSERIEHVHRKLGLNIDATTAANLWDGHRMSDADYGDLVQGLLAADARL